MKQLQNKTRNQSQYDPQHPYIPISMFLYFPSTQDQYYLGQAKSIRRYIMQATAKNTYTEYQKQKFKEFKQYYQANKKNLPKILIDNPFWIDSWKFRWGTSQAWNNKQTIKSMQQYSIYLQTNRTTPSSTIQNHLKQGIFYISGRDAFYRPILIFDVDKMIKLKINQNLLLQCQKFFFQKVLNQYLLPGQVQTWNAIIDVGYRNVMSLVSPLKASISFLSNTYRNRMKIAYIVRIPGTLSFLWKIVKKFMHQQTVQKINFIDEQYVTHLLSYTNPSQLQQKYGGTQPQITQFWPVRQVDKLQQLNLLNFSHPNINKPPISKQAYQLKVKNGQLPEHIISNKLLPIVQTNERKPQEQISPPTNHPTQIITQGKNPLPQQKTSQNISVKIWPQQYTPLQPIISTQTLLTDWNYFSN